jgi:hypothetical protein
VRIFLACAALAALLLSPGLVIGPSLDAAVFTHVAERMRDGATLYVDVWDHKPPGIYLLLVLGQTLLPFLAPWTVSWLLSVAATAGAATAVAAVCRRLLVSPPASLAAALITVVVMGQFLTALGGGLTEPIAALPVAVALALVLQPGTHSPWRAFQAGLLLALGLLLSVQVAAAILPVAAVALAASSRRGITLGAMVLGGLLPILAVGLWLSAAGALPAAIDAVANYGAAYRAVGISIGSGLAGPVMAWTLFVLLFLVIPVFHGSAASLRLGGLPRLVGLACLAWMGLAVISFVAQGRFLGHYVIPLAVPIGVLSGIGLDRLRVVAGVQRARLLIPVVLTVVISSFATFAAGSMEYAPIASDHARSKAAAEIIRSATSDQDRIWVWGNEPELYLEADRPSATPYSYLYPLVTPGYATPQLIASTLAQLTPNPPRLIVDAGSSAPGEPGFQALLIPRPLASDGRDLDLLDPLRDFVRANYSELITVDGWVVYEIRDSAAASGRSGSSQLLRAATRR